MKQYRFFRKIIQLRDTKSRLRTEPSFSNRYCIITRRNILHRKISDILRVKRILSATSHRNSNKNMYNFFLYVFYNYTHTNNLWIDNIYNDVQNTRTTRTFFNFNLNTHIYVEKKINFRLRVYSESLLRESFSVRSKVLSNRMCFFFFFSDNIFSVVKILRHLHTAPKKMQDFPPIGTVIRITDYILNDLRWILSTTTEKHKKKNVFYPRRFTEHRSELISDCDGGNVVSKINRGELHSEHSAYQ